MSANEQRRTGATPASHANCIICGPRNPHSLGLEFHPDAEGRAVCHIQGSRWWQGYTDILHGGMISSLLDAAMTHCLFLRGIEAVTVDLSVRFKHAVPCEEDLVVRAWVVENPYRVLYRMKAELLVGDVVMASATARFFLRSAKEEAVVVHG